jgi:hypothetical protein
MDAVEVEERGTKRAPGLQIVIVTDGRSEIAYQPETRVRLIDVTPAPEPEPAIRPDADMGPAAHRRAPLRQAPVDDGADPRRRSRVGTIKV